MEASNDDDVRAWLGRVAVDDAVHRHHALDDVQQALFSTRGPPLTVGRYRVLGRLGGGGQGVVHIGHDPDLDRKVAIKLLRAGNDAEARARLVREANALAQLAHPNVVAVLDVGTCTAGVYVVTELVEGQTLRDWLRTPRPWRAVVDTMIAAGRGLVAAHAQGIVHRDFKPANVLIGADGGVRLLDFGLARTTAEDPSTPGAVLRSGPVGDGSLTQPGHAIGTPLYMAPEQHVGGHATAAADQYAFCVALHEALWARRPFDGPELEDIVRAKQRGELPPRPRGDAVPRVLHRAVQRGLSPDPARRFPSMDALLAVLERAHASRRRPLVVAGLATALVLGTSAAAFVEDEAPRCAVASSWSQTWSDDRRIAMVAAFHATDLSFAPRTAATVAARLDEYGAAWEQMRAEACAVVELDPSADARLACLDRLHADADALVAVLVDADAGTVARSGSAVAALVDPRQCDGPGPSRPAPAIAGRVSALRGEVARARSLAQAGQYDDALATIEPLEDAIRVTDHAPLAAEAGLVHGEIVRSLARLDEAAARLEAAHAGASAIEYDAVTFDTALALVHLHGNDRRDPQAAEPWMRAAEAVLARMGEPADPLLDARLALAGAGVALSAGKFDEALELSQRAVDRIESEQSRPSGTDFTRAAVAWSTLGQAYLRLGRLAEAEDAGRRSLEIAERRSGPRHPDVAWALQVIALVEKKRGRFTDALALQERVLAIREEAFGLDDPTLAGTLGNIGVLQSELARPVEAEASYRRALDIQRTRLGDDHPDVARTLHNLAITLRDLHRWDEAFAAWHEAIALADRTLGREHPDLAAYLAGLGSVLADTERADEAVELCERAYAIRSAALGDEHPATAEVSVQLGHARRRAGDLVGARADIERGLAVFERVLGPDHVESARSLHELANVLGERGEVVESLAMHRRALAVLERGLGPDHSGLGDVLMSIADREAALGRTDEAAATVARARAIWGDSVPLCEECPPEP